MKPSPAIDNKAATSDGCQTVTSAKSPGNGKGGFPQRTIHLLTWLQAPVSSNSIIDPRTAFAHKVVELFEKQKSQLVKQLEPEDGNADPQLVDRWVCSLEDHKTSGQHFHLLLRTKRKVRAYHVWKDLQDQGIKVHFSNKPGTYWNAFGYVTKSDKHFQQSEFHPSNGAQPIITQEDQPTSESTSTTNHPLASTNPPKKRKLTPEEMRIVIQQNNIRDDDELCAFASKMEAEGSTDVLHWVLNNRGKIQRIEMINTVWDLQEAPERIKSRNQLKVFKFFINQNRLLNWEGFSISRGFQ